MKKKIKSFEEMSIKERREVLRAKLGKDELANESIMPEDREPRLEELKLMKLIWSTEPMGFFDLCNELRKTGDCPLKGEKQEWAILFSKINSIERCGWVECTRSGKSIETLQLTDLGAEVVRSYADSKRELIQIAEESYEEEWDSSKYNFTKDRPF